MTTAWTVFSRVGTFAGNLLSILVLLGIAALLWDSRPRRPKRSARRELRDVATVDDIARRWSQS